MEKIGYMCAIDYYWHVEGDYYGTNIYPSMKALKDNRRCIPGCGAVKVKVTLEKVTIKGKSNGYRR